jgi:hypothetical protein
MDNYEASRILSQARAILEVMKEEADLEAADDLARQVIGMIKGNSISTTFCAIASVFSCLAETSPDPEIVGPMFQMLVQEYKNARGEDQGVGGEAGSSVPTLN